MYKYYDKDMANEKSNSLGLSDEEDRKILTNMRRHSIYMDNQILNKQQTVEATRQYCTTKKKMREILMTRIEHIDVSFLNLN